MFAVKFMTGGFMSFCVMVTDLLAVNHKGCSRSVCDPAVNPSDPQLSKVAEKPFSHVMNYCITGSNRPA